MTSENVGILTYIDSSKNKYILYPVTKAEAIEGLDDIVCTDYDSTATYAVGAYCMYSNALYRCTSAISTAEAFTVAHWAEVSVASELKRIDHTVTVSVPTSWSGSGPYTQTVTVSGLKTTDVFAVECGVLSDTTADNAKSWRKMFSCVTAAKCDADGALVLTCHNKKPTASFNIRVRGVSG